MCKHEQITFRLQCCCFKCVLLSLWCLGRKVLGNCIDSWSLPSFLFSVSDLFACVYTLIKSTKNEIHSFYAVWSESMLRILYMVPLYLDPHTQSLLGVGVPLSWFSLEMRASLAETKKTLSLASFKSVTFNSLQRNSKFLSRCCFRTC